MTLTIELKPELEAQLRVEATKDGVDEAAYIVHAIEERLQRRDHRSMPPHLSARESTLLQEINQGLPEETWAEYHDLISKRREETLTPIEYDRLLSLSDQIESSHAVRLSRVAELAELQGASFDALILRLGIRPREV